MALATPRAPGATPPPTRAQSRLSAANGQPRSIHAVVLFQPLSRGPRPTNRCLAGAWRTRSPRPQRVDSQNFRHSASV
eukprot:3154366-Pleurochrysis_carterae.AAC.1